MFINFIVFLVNAAFCSLNIHMYVQYYKPIQLSGAVLTGLLAIYFAIVTGVEEIKEEMRKK